MFWFPSTICFTRLLILEKTFHISLLYLGLLGYPKLMSSSTFVSITFPRQENVLIVYVSTSAIQKSLDLVVDGNLTTKAISSSNRVLPSSSGVFKKSNYPSSSEDQMKFRPLSRKELKVILLRTQTASFRMHNV